MVIVNFRVVMGAEGDGGIAGLISGAIEGRAAATFVVLAGVGLGLSARRDTNRPILPVTLKRAAFLLATGLLNSLVFDADILHYYAFYFLFGVLFLRSSRASLLSAIAVLNGVFVLLVLTLDYDAGWNWSNYSYADFWTPNGFVRNLFFNGWHPVFPWLGFLLFGFFLSRLPLSATATQTRLLLYGVFTVIVAELASHLLSAPLRSLDPELAIFATTQPVPPMPLYSVAGAGFSALVIGACLRCSHWLDRLGVLGLLAPAGRQSLTLYIAHILLGMGTLDALGLLGEQTAAHALFAALLFCLLAVIYALLWTRYFKRGPAEMLMRKLAA